MRRDRGRGGSTPDFDDVDVISIQVQVQILRSFFVSLYFESPGHGPVIVQN